MAGFAEHLQTTIAGNHHTPSEQQYLAARSQLKRLLEEDAKKQGIHRKFSVAAFSHVADRVPLDDLIKLEREFLIVLDMLVDAYDNGKHELGFG